MQVVGTLPARPVNHRLPFLYLSLLLAVCLPLSSRALLMFEHVDAEDWCLLTMCEVDSGCVPHGCNTDQYGRIGCGYFRLNIYQFRQCFQPGKQDDEDEELAWIHCAEDYDCSAQCIRALGRRFRVKCYGKSDCESMARIHDGGANGCRDRGTQFYWRRVRHTCGANCTLPIFKRHIRRR